MSTTNSQLQLIREREREGDELDKTGSTEEDKDNVSPTPEDVDCTDKLYDAREPEPRMELLTSDVDDHNLEGVGRQTVESTAQGLPGRGSIWVQASKLRRLHSMPKKPQPLMLGERDFIEILQHFLSTGSQVFFATLPEKTHLASVHVSNG